MKTQFRGQPLIEQGRDVSQIRFLEGKFGKEFLEEYDKRVRSEYYDNQNLIHFGEEFRAEQYRRYIAGYKGPGRIAVEGSSPFIVVLANEILREEDLRTASQADLEKALRLETLDLMGAYVDTGLVLRSKGEPNKYLARDLTRQLRKRGLESRTPTVINLYDLTLRKDPDSPYGLVFDLREDAAPFYAPVLNSPSDSRFDPKDISDATGLPTKVGEEGYRCLYTRNFGLSRLNLNWCLDTLSHDGPLASSDSSGRVVVVSGAATQKKAK